MMSDEMITSTEDELTDLKANWRDFGLKWENLGDFTQGDIDELKDQWFLDNALKRGQLQSIWARHYRHSTHKGPEVGSPSSTVSSKQSGEATEVFTSDYKTVPTGDVRKVLIQYINKCAQLFHSPESSSSESSTAYYSPYITMVQSSGYGKTALVLEIAKQIKSYYICLREASSSGEPKRTSAVANSDYFSGDFDASAKKENFQTFFKKLKNNADRFDNASELLEAQKVMNPDRNRSFWNKLLQESVNATTSKDFILLIIDEARSLKPDNNASGDFYLPLSRALSESSGIFCILIDTNAKIANFAPVNAEDPSARVVRGEQLFHPWTCIPTMEIHLELPNVVRTWRDTITVDNQRVFEFNRFDIVRHSRPLFHRALLLMNSTEPEILWDNLVFFSCYKLFGSNCSDMNTALAVLAGRYCLIPVDTSTQESLVANRMATLNVLSKSQGRMLVSYVAEPVLGEGLACRMADRFKPIIKLLSELMMSGRLSLAGNKGDYGELIAAVCLSTAYDVLHIERKHFSFPVMVKAMLAKFNIRKCTKHQKTRPLKSSTPDTFPDVLSSLVSFLQFVRLSKSPSQETLRKGFERRVAFFTHANGEPACDLVIPILLFREAEKIKYYGVDAEEGGHEDGDEQRLEGKAEQVEKVDSGYTKISKLTTEEQKDDAAPMQKRKRHARADTKTEAQKKNVEDLARKPQKQKQSGAMKGKPKKSESDKLLEKYFAVDTRDASPSSLPCSSSSSSSATAATSKKACADIKEVAAFSAIFVQAKHYAQKVSASEIQQLTDDLKNYGYEVLGKETPFVTMVMLLGPEENANQSLDDDESCTVHLHGGCVEMVVRGLLPCSEFLPKTERDYLNHCLDSLVDQARNAFVSEYKFTERDAKFAAEGTDIADVC